MSRRLWVLSALALVVMGLAGLSVYVWQRNGLYGFNVFFRHGGTYWTTVKGDDPRLTPSMQLALKPGLPPAVPGTLTWREVEPGFEVADLPVLVGGKAVDRFLLHRVDPARYRLVARNAPDGDRDIRQWETALPQAVLIVNGAYFGQKGQPDTPFISEGRALGPQTYDAHAGVFVATDSGAHVVDLTHGNWRDAVQGARNAMVSYPLLIGDDGQTHVPVKSNWLANRTFVAEDHQGRILIGSTQDAFFSLGRMAEFLKAAPLDIKTALNLDGGPVACLSVRLNGYRRMHYAWSEAQVSDTGTVRLLRWPLQNVPPAMDIVLTVERKPGS